MVYKKAHKKHGVSMTKRMQTDKITLLNCYVTLLI